MISIELNYQVWNEFKTWQGITAQYLLIFFFIVQCIFIIFAILWMFIPKGRVERLRKYQVNLEELYGHLNYEDSIACWEPILYMFNRFVFVIGCYAI